MTDQAVCGAVMTHWIFSSSLKFERTSVISDQ